MAMIGKVKRMHFREKRSVREIVRLTSLSRNTVRKWLKTPVLEEPRYRRSDTPGKLTPFHDAIKQALKVDAHRPRHERRTARALHAQIKAEGYAGGYSRVTDFVRAWRQGEGQSVSTKAFVPLAFELGEAFQFDWSEEGLVVGGIYYPHAGLAPQAVRLAGLLARGLPEPRPRDAVRRAHPLLRGHGRHRATGHLRQHEDGGRQGQEGQGSHRQQALRRDVRALPVRRRLLQRGLGLGEGVSSRRTFRTAAGASGSRRTR